MINFNLKIFCFSEFVKAGVRNLKYAGAQERKIVRTVEHPDYYEHKVYFDVSLAFLEQVYSYHFIF